MRIAGQGMLVDGSTSSPDQGRMVWGQQYSLLAQILALEPYSLLTTPSAQVRLPRPNLVPCCTGAWCDDPLVGCTKPACCRAVH